MDDAPRSRRHRPPPPAADSGPARRSRGARRTTPGRRPLRSATALAAAISLAALSVLATGCGEESEPAVTPTSSTRAAAPRVVDDLQTAYQDVIEDVLPSVVQIEAGDSLGSGVVYDERGHLITNAHVVDSADSFQITVATGEEPVPAKLVSSYPEQDLAVLKLDRVPTGVKPAVFGDSSQVQVGQIVLAMGSPLGLSGSVTQGIVSAVGRTVTESSSGGGTGATIGNMVQTSAAINPGNSGGALVNLDSRIIGIPTLAATDPDLGNSAAPGIGFAIPASMVKTVADQIITTGRVTDSGRAALGITARTVLDDNYQPSGTAVVDVEKGGPADDAGLKSGDIITRLGSAQITTITSLAEALASESPGDKVVVAYTRGGERRSAQVTLGEI
ncbi:trypsin-like peptidase domain-containing protein [Streptomyces sp. NPDC020875]|uniref:S1C family serine protease n=1 Tax=Streptomyces sp. NPDC020875 TaxID=3154898 RepID=UPI0033C77AB8